jgi:hypothetical protein
VTASVARIVLGDAGLGEGEENPALQGQFGLPLVCLVKLNVRFSALPRYPPKTGMSEKLPSAIAGARDHFFSGADVRAVCGEWPASVQSRRQWPPEVAATFHAYCRIGPAS